MTIDKIYSYVLDLWRKDHKGVVLPPAVFNNWIQFVSLGMYDEIFTQAESLAAQGNVDMSEVIFKMTVLGNFISDVALVPTSGSVGGLNIAYVITPTNCKYPLGLQSVLPLNNGVSRVVELRSPVLKTKYRGSALNGDIANVPVGFVENGRIEFIPNDLTDFILTYLRTPAVPYFDFCVSSSDQLVFMPVGSYINNEPFPTVTPGPGEDPPPSPDFPVGTTLNLYQRVGAFGSTLIASDVIKEGITTAIYWSITSELDWDETQHMKIANLVAEKLGINLRIQK